MVWSWLVFFQWDCDGRGLSTGPILVHFCGHTGRRLCACFNSLIYWFHATCNGTNWTPVQASTRRSMVQDIRSSPPNIHDARDRLQHFRSFRSTNQEVNVLAFSASVLTNQEKGNYGDADASPKETHTQNPAQSQKLPQAASSQSPELAMDWSKSVVFLKFITILKQVRCVEVRHQMVATLLLAVPQMMCLRL